MQINTLPARLFATVALILVGFQLYTAAYAPLSAIFQRSAHLTLVMVLVFLLAGRRRRDPVRYPVGEGALHRHGQNDVDVAVLC